MERRYTLLIIAVVFVLLSATAFTICYQHHTIKTEQSLKEDRSDANHISLILDEHLKKTVRIMESYTNRLSLLQAVRNKNAEKAMLHLINLKKSNPDIDILVITDRQGTLWAAYPERPELLGQNLAYRDWYKGVSKEWKSNISDVVLRIVREKDLAVTISVPIFDKTGEVIGILMNTEQTVGLSYLFKQVSLDPSQNITVTDRKGQIVYSTRYNVEKEIRPYPFHPDIKKAMAANIKTFAVDDPNLGGRTSYISFAPVVDIGWTVFVERDKWSIFLSDLAYYVQVAAIAFLLFLSISLFLAYSRKQVKAQQILEQLQAEKIIRAGTERYRSYIDLTMQVGWTTNDTGELVEDNPSWSEYTGRGYEEIKGFGWIKDIHPDDRDHTGQIWRKAVAEKSFYETEYRIRRYDGVYRDHLIRGMPLLAENGSVREWVGTCIDITEVKRITAAMVENDGKYRALFENQLNGLAYCKIVVDENNRPVDYIFLEINNAFEEHTGLKKKDVLGRRIKEIIPGFEKSAFDFIGVHGRVALTGEAVRFEQYQEGLQRWYSVFVYSPKEGYFVSIFSDITNRKQMDKALRESEARYRSIFENAQEGIYRSTPEGRIILANQAMAKIYGYASPEEFMSGITDAARQIYVDPEERAKIMQIVEERGLIVNRETQVYRKDGIIIWISLTIDAVRDEKEQILYYEGMIEDITNRKENVERMRKALGATVQAIAVTVETRDPYTAGHQRRVANLARSIATEMNLPADQVDGIRMAAIIHDLGKLSVPAEILSKPTKLTNIEFSLIKTHAQSGYDILKDIDFPWPIARMVLEHHERMDGSGYPNGLTAEETIVESRILSVADVVEAMASHRPYRPGLGFDAALEEIEKNRGTLYDNTVADACLRLFREKGFQLTET